MKKGFSHRLYSSPMEKILDQDEKATTITNPDQEVKTFFRKLLYSVHKPMYRVYEVNRRGEGIVYEIYQRRFYFFYTLASTYPFLDDAKNAIRAGKGMYIAKRLVHIE